MSFHQNDEPGKQIDITGLDRLIKNNSINVGDEEKLSLTGFFTADILNKVLAEPDCVGIRIYNAAFFFNEFLIMVGVKSDGSEIQQRSDEESGYAISGVKFVESDGHLVKTLEIKQVDRMQAAESVWNGWAKSDQTGGDDISFASYFSAQTIQKLLTTPDCNGISFYVIGLIHEGEFPFTHLAIPSKHIDFKEIELRSQEGNCIICPVPCPPRCAPGHSTAPAEPGSVTLVNRTNNVQINESSLEIYLIKWNQFPSLAS